MGWCYGNKIAEGAGIRKDRKGLRLPLWTPSVIAYFSVSTLARPSPIKLRPSNWARLPIAHYLPKRRLFTSPDALLRA